MVPNLYVTKTKQRLQKATKIPIELTTPSRFVNR